MSWSTLVVTLFSLLGAPATECPKADRAAFGIADICQATSPYWVAPPPPEEESADSRHKKATQTVSATPVDADTLTQRISNGF